jgi:release factor glutamine methyltransferase
VSGTIRAALAAAAVGLGGDEARREAEILLLHVLGQPRAWLYGHADDDIDPAVGRRVRELVSRRAAGEPLVYITGRREFWSLDLAVSPAVLIPRPETELLVELALSHIPQSLQVDIADLGTGSGAIALAMARERPNARVLASDSSAAALAIARGNAGRLGIGNVEFAQGDWWDAVPGRQFDLVVSNPPYIAAADMHLQQGDLRFEPRTALASGPDGLDAIRAIVAGAPAHLRAGGWLLLEHGFDQARAVRELLQEMGMVDVVTACDLERRERVTSGRHTA